MPIGVYGSGRNNLQSATVASIYTKGHHSGKGKLKPVASPQPPPDYQTHQLQPSQVAPPKRPNHPKEYLRPDSSVNLRPDSSANFRSESSANFRPESSVYNYDENHAYCSTTSSYVTTTDQSSSRSSTVQGWRERVIQQDEYGAPLSPNTSKYMRDYIEYSTEKRKRTIQSRQVGTRFSSNMDRQSGGVDTSEARGNARAQGGGAAASKGPRHLSRKASAKGRVVTTSIRRKRSVRQQRPSGEYSVSSKKAVQTNQTLKSCRSVSEIETLLPQKAVQEQHSSSCCQRQGGQYQVALEKAKKAADELHQERVKERTKSCKTNTCCDQR